MQKWISRLSETLQLPLPGSAAHALMSPAGRGNTEEYIISLSEPPRNSAVLMILFPQEDSLKMVLIKRPDYEGVHGGQVSFPGGKFEDKDIEFVQTALRETQEEIGIPSDQIRIVGALSRIYIPPSNFLVYPYIGFCETIPVFSTDVEVDRVITVPADLILDDSIIHEGKFMAGGRLSFEIKAPYFDMDGERVWGATACILSEFKQIWKTVKAE